MNKKRNNLLALYNVKNSGGKYSGKTKEGRQKMDDYCYFAFGDDGCGSRMF